ncbi:precorrin-2 C(20)-methyltransferase [Ornithinimicrobium tianjinense]|uniref:Precorrin-3B C(17)-methyltransferase n=1 Tax=Ornithinimicrobium tianjinense TaxID=1195761 RepID=A0A917FAJ5_9MICO|nr:precorrin-2 C(20)-methyltransferase [Ornithinimicrobium tianjinense]GGF60586.1 precorrin-3B C(17)-methyltransferase [Ornithinimicrobium tianjinense]
MSGGEGGGEGRLYGIGVGPGDPELLTLRAARILGSADVVAFHAGTGRTSNARSIVAHLLPEGVVEEELRYPVTTGSTDHPDGYYGALTDFYEECAERLEAHLAQGRTVALVALGDPLFYGSPMYVLDRLSPQWPTEVVPGITSLSAATAAASTPLCRHEDTLTVLSGTLPVPELARRLADTDAAVVMKLGRTFAGVREALRQAGVLDRAVYVERASGAGQRVLPAADVDPGTVPYLSLVLVPGQDLRADDAGRAGSRREPTRRGTATATTSSNGTTTGTVHVVGLGPGPDRWLSPEAAEVLGRVDHVIGYAPYVARVPQRPGLTRHASGNTVELDRGSLALDLALRGEDVAVVSGGDAGVFGMATAVFESQAQDEARYAAVPVHVIPGITAAHAASALAGAVLGGDHALVNLSDNLKPWEVLAERLLALVRADLAVALYNPRSRSRPDTLGATRQLLIDAVGPDRVVVVARQVGRDGEELQVTTLGGLDPETVDMGCTVIVGASSTRVTPDGRVWTPRAVAAVPSVGG